MKKYLITLLVSILLLGFNVIIDAGEALESKEAQEAREDLESGEALTSGGAQDSGEALVYSVPGSTYCSSPGLAIPDNNPTGVTDDLVISGFGSITDLNVSLNVTHTWVGDLIFTLEHVDTGTTVTIIDRPGYTGSGNGCSKNDIDATLDDEASLPVEDECENGVSIYGTFTPNNPLSAFDSEDISGTWRMTVSDNANIDLGVLNSWCLMTPSKHDVIIDFGAVDGLWAFMNNSLWTQLHNLSPEIITTGDIDGEGKDDVIIDFGAAFGIWAFMNNSVWTQLHNLSSEAITTGDIDGEGKDDVIIDFGAVDGLWAFMNNSGWVQLHNISPEIIDANGDIDGEGKDDVIIDFGPALGIWAFMNNSGWVQLHDLSTEAITTGNIDGDEAGKDDVIIDFGPAFGLWGFMNNSVWTPLHGLSPEAITTGEIDGN